MGGCTKALIAARLGYTPLPTPPKMQKVFEEGQRYEDIVIERLRGEGWYIDTGKTKGESGAEDGRTGHRVEIPITSSAIVQGHLDGIAVLPEEPREKVVLEVKSMSGEEFRKWETWGWDSPGLVQRYKWQISVYIVATGLPCVVMVVERDERKETGELSLLQRTVSKPFFNRTEIRARVLGAEATAFGGALPVECDSPFYPCPYLYLHEDDPEITTDETIDLLAVEYKSAASQEKIAKERMGVIRDSIRNALGDRIQVTTSRATVSLTTVKSRKVSEQKMKDAGLDVEEFKVDGEYKRLGVYVKGERDG